MQHTVLSDEAVHDAALRLRESLKALPFASDRDRADIDTVLAWVARQTEIPEVYRRAQIPSDGAMHSETSNS